MIGTKIDKYELLKTLGRGGMGIVYQARQGGLRRIVALKTIVKGKQCCKEHLARFHREARALASLRHPNIVRLYDFGFAYGNPYFVMEYLEADNLEEYLLRRGEALAVEEVINFGIQLSEALSAIHEKELVHRDIKPTNVLISPKGKLKLTDFGLVGDNSKFTWSIDGQPMGTPQYIAPEVACGERATKESDIYQLGLLLYEMVTGDAPYSGSQMDDLLHNVVFSKVESPRQQGLDIPIKFDSLIMRCLAKEPKDRFQSAKEVAQVLRDLQKGKNEPSSKVTCDKPNEKFAPRLVAVSFLAVFAYCLWQYFAFPQVNLEKVKLQWQSLNSVTITWLTNEKTVSFATFMRQGKKVERKLCDKPSRYHRLHFERLALGESVSQLVFHFRSRNVTRESGINSISLENKLRLFCELVDQLSISKLLCQLQGVQKEKEAIALLRKQEAITTYWALKPILREYFKTQHDDNRMSLALYQALYELSPLDEQLTQNGLACLLKPAELYEPYIVANNLKELPKGLAHQLLRLPGDGMPLLASKRQLRSHIEKWTCPKGKKVRLVLKVTPLAFHEQVKVTINERLSLKLAQKEGAGDYLVADFPAYFLQKGANEIDLALLGCGQPRLQGLWLYGL